MAAEFKDNQLQVNVSDGTYNIQFYTPKITETTFLPTGETVLFNKSHAVVLNKAFSDVTYKEDGANVTFNSKDLSVKISKQPFKISYWFKGKENHFRKKWLSKNRCI